MVDTKNTMGNQQSEVNYPRAKPASPITIPNAPQSKFKGGDLLFTVGAFEGLPEGTIVNVFYYRDDNTYVVQDRTGRHFQLPESALSFTSKIRRDAPIDVPWAQREKRVDPEQEQEQEDEEEGEEEGEEHEMAAPIHYQPCGKCTIDWQCACNNKDIEVNGNFDDELTRALQESEQEAKEEAAAIAASLGERDVADLDD